MTDHRRSTHPAQEPRPRTGGRPATAPWDPLLVEQDQVWVDRHGTRHALTGMSYQYRAAVLDLLHGTAQRLWMDYHVATLHRLVSDVLEHGRVPGELLADQFEVVPSHRMEPVAWLDSTPLVRALQRHQHRT